MSVVTSDLDVAERNWLDTARLYVDITRPKVIGLVVFTGLPALLLGAHGPLDLARMAWVLLGTGLAGGASSALNAYVERETDAHMARTRRRPLPASSLLPRVVLGYGVAMTIVSSIILGVVGGPLAVAVSLGTIAFYVGVYTLWLKPRTPQNIVIGGAAGATAPLIASAAMTGSLSLGAWILFAIIFLWTPPHFWAIAIVRRSEYANAGFPMMPLVVGDRATRWRSLAYALALVPVTLLPWWMGDVGRAYGFTAVALDVWFVAEVVRSMVLEQQAADWRVFKSSVAYLFFVFAALLLDLVF